MEEAIFNIFGKNGENKKPAAVAFVDYEHWYISMYRMYHEKPDIRQWRNDIAQYYDVRDILFFGDFSNQSLRADIPRIREVSSSIIETQNASAHHKKDYTDFIMLDHIYQRAITYGGDTDVFIIFSGDGHFSSVASFLVNRCNKNVVVYGIRDCLSTQLKNTASTAIEWPPRESVAQTESEQTKRTDKTAYARKAEKGRDKPAKSEKAEKTAQKNETAEKAALKNEKTAKKVQKKKVKTDKEKDSDKVIVSDKEKSDKSDKSDKNVKKSETGRGTSAKKGGTKSSGTKNVSSDLKGGEKQVRQGKQEKKSPVPDSGSKKKDSLSHTIEELDKLTRGSSGSDGEDMFVPYYKEILSNISFHDKSNTGKAQLRHTYSSTIDAAAEYYRRDRDVVAVALDRMCERGYITLGRGSGFGKGSKIITVDWEKVKKDKLV